MPSSQGDERTRTYLTSYADLENWNQAYRKIHNDPLHAHAWFEAFQHHTLILVMYAAQVAVIESSRRLTTNRHDNSFDAMTVLSLHFNSTSVWKVFASTCLTDLENRTISQSNNLQARIAAIRLTAMILYRMFGEGVCGGRGVRATAAEIDDPCRFMCHEVAWIMRQQHQLEHLTKSHSSSSSSPV